MQRAGVSSCSRWMTSRGGEREGTTAPNDERGQQRATSRGPTDNQTNTTANTNSQQTDDDGDNRQTVETTTGRRRQRRPRQTAARQASSRAKQGTRNRSDTKASMHSSTASTARQANNDTQTHTHTRTHAPPRAPHSTSERRGPASDQPHTHTRTRRHTCTKARDAQTHRQNRSHGSLLVGHTSLPAHTSHDEHGSPELPLAPCVARHTPCYACPYTRHMMSMGVQSYPWPPALQEIPPATLARTHVT
jgi:hypothetical protein